MLLFVSIFLVSALLTGAVRVYLVKQRVLDLPNARSSHAVPIPRGGGLGIVLVLLATVVWFVQKHLLPVRLAWALVGGGIAVSVVGILDDYFTLPRWPRLLIHTSAAVWALSCLEEVAPARLGNTGSIWSWAGQGIVLIALVWLTNLFNFMDGIDGLAGMEAVCVGLLGAFLLFRNGLPTFAPAFLILAAASLGFLAWNWPPAKIFMGDAGSGFIGFSLGVLVLFASNSSNASFWPWFILLAAFIVDSTITLLRRAFSGARWYEAHRSHAYQNAALAWGSHLKVTLATAGINLVWLFPMAWAAFRFPREAPEIALLAVAPLICIAFHFRAGSKDHVSDFEIHGSESK
jgi:Fuc2NAc and GlcNAc transferase